MGRPSRYSPEVRERAVRLVFEHEGQYESQWVNPIRSIRSHEFKYNLYVQFGEELYDLKNDPEEIVNLAGDAA